MRLAPLSLSCREAVELLHDYLANELDPDPRVALERHLAVCAACRAYLDGYVRTVELVRLAWSDDELAVDSLAPDLLRAVLAARA